MSNDFEYLIDTIRSLIKHEIEYNEISITEIARRTGMAPCTVTAYLNGDRDAYTVTVMKLLSAVGYTLKLVPKDE